MQDLKLVLVVLLVALPVAGAAPTGWIVRSADGTLVGSLLPAAGDPVVTEGFAKDSPVRVARRIPGNWIQLLMSQDAVWATRDRVPFLYEDYDCSGPAFLEAPQNTNAVRAAVVFDTEVFWPKGPGESRVIRAKGVLVGDPGRCDATLVEPDLCCTVVEAEETRFVAGASGAALADLHLRAPFRFEPVAAPADR